MNGKVSITTEQAMELKGLIQIVEAQKNLVTQAIHISPVLYEKAQINYEDACMDVWAFMNRVGRRPDCKVIIPEV